MAVLTLTRRAMILTLLAACSSAPRFLTYDGPRVTEIRVFKAARRMQLLHGETVLRDYEIGLGFAPVGHKEREGDGRTPEGVYEIDRRNPRSAYHLSLGISYPNEADIAHARELGVSPGGDIFIHGRGPNHRRARGDWSVGCITVTDREIEEIYSMVDDGTRIVLAP